MGTIHKPDYSAIAIFLQSKGIDAFRVREDAFDETGYDYIKVYDNGRPIYDHNNRLTFVRTPWPSYDVYELVHELYFGTKPVKPVKKAAPAKKADTK